tara:strand:- start:72 stop:227 length:156 start_codon:yes stop_codon:yes gene_type:complete
MFFQPAHLMEIGIGTSASPSLGIMMPPSTTVTLYGNEGDDFIGERKEFRLT